MSLSFATYADPDFGVLLPTALVLAALGTNEYTIRKFRPLLAENEDYLRIRGEDHVERLFYSAAGLIKLCDSIASPQAQALKQSLTQFLQTQSQPSSVAQPVSSTRTGWRGGSMVPAMPQAVQPAPSSASSLDPYAPARVYRTPPSAPTPTVASAYPDSPASAALESEDPAAMIAQRLAPHLSGQIAAQVSSRVERALTRLEQRQTPQLSQAELLLQQQRLSLEQFQAIQQTILAAQQAAIDNTHKVVGALPVPEVNLYNSVQQPDLPPDLWYKLMASMQIRSWSDLAMVVGGLLALGLSSFLLLSTMMRSPQRSRVAPVPPPQMVTPTPVPPVRPLPQP